MSNIVFVSGHYPLDTYFSIKTRELFTKYTEKNNYNFYYDETEVTENYTSSLHFRRCISIKDASLKYPDAKWFVWVDSDVYVNSEKMDMKLENYIDLSNENILYHLFHESPWGCYPINTGVKIVNRKALIYEAEIWDLRNTNPWNTFPYEQKTLYEYVLPKLNKNEYIIHDPYVLNCITQAYPDKIKDALFIHMCGMTSEERKKYIDNVLSIKK